MDVDYIQQALEKLSCNAYLNMRGNIKEMPQFADRKKSGESLVRKSGQSDLNPKAETHHQTAALKAKPSLSSLLNVEKLEFPFEAGKKRSFLKKLNVYQGYFFLKN